MGANQLHTMSWVLSGYHSLNENALPLIILIYTRIAWHRLCADVFFFYIIREKGEKKKKKERQKAESSLSYRECKRLRRVPFMPHKRILLSSLKHTGLITPAHFCFFFFFALLLGR